MTWGALPPAPANFLMNGSLRVIDPVPVGQRKTGSRKVRCSAYRRAPNPNPLPPVVVSFALMIGELKNSAGIARQPNDYNCENYFHSWRESAVSPTCQVGDSRGNTGRERHFYTSGESLFTHSHILHTLAARNRVPSVKGRPMKAEL